MQTAPQQQRESMVDPSESAELAAADSPSPPRRRLWRYMLTVLLVLAAFWCGYPALLRMVSRSLTQVDPLQSVKTLIVLDGERGFQFAADQLQQGQAETLLLYDKVHSRVVELGVIPSHLELSRQAAAKTGIPAESLREIPEPVDRIDDLLKIAVDRQAEGDRVGLVMTRWRSALIRRNLQKLTQGNESRRPLVFGLDDPEVDPENWWRTRHGVRLVCDQWMRAWAAWLSGDERPTIMRTANDFRKATIAE